MQWATVPSIIDEVSEELDDLFETSAAAILSGGPTTFNGKPANWLFDW